MRLRLSILIVLALILGPGGALAAERPKAHRRTEAAAEPVEPDPGLGPLLHASPAQVRARLGDPDVARAEGKGGMWTYRLPRCALFLFFYEGPKGLRVSGASTGVRKRGEPPMDVKACVASGVQIDPPPDLASEH